MEFSMKKLLSASASKLKKLRDEFGYSRKQMAAYFEVTRSGYHRNERGLNLPRLQSLHKLCIERDISMDWYLFDKGPMVYSEKGKAEELQDTVRELEKRNEELEKRNRELEKEKEEENEQNREKIMEAETTLTELKPDVEELVTHMAGIPLLYYEIMAHYQRFKVDNKELMESLPEASG